MLLSSEPCLFSNDPFIFMLICLYQINTSQGGPCTTWQLGLGRYSLFFDLIYSGKKEFSLDFLCVYWSKFIINHIFLYTHIYENPFPKKQTEKATIKRFLITNERPVFSRTTGD